MNKDEKEVQVKENGSPDLKEMSGVNSDGSPKYDEPAQESEEVEETPITATQVMINEAWEAIGEDKELEALIEDLNDDKKALYLHAFAKRIAKTPVKRAAPKSAGKGMTAGATKDVEPLKPLDPLMGADAIWKSIAEAHNKHK